MKKIRRNYSLEFKIQAVSLSEQRGNVSLVAQELGICKESLVNWRKLHKEGKIKGKINPKTTPSVPYIASILSGVFKNGIRSSIIIFKNKINIPIVTIFFNDRPTIRITYPIVMYIKKAIEKFEI